MIEDYENNTNKNFKRDISSTLYVKNLRFTAFIFLCRSCSYCHYFDTTATKAIYLTKPGKKEEEDVFL
jgi:hypothetical protein